MQNANMTRQLAAGLIAAVMGFIVLAATAAQAECVRNIPLNDVLWIRSGPGSNFSKIGSFGRSECGIHVSWNSCQGGWCPVQKGSRSGWSHTDYLGAGGGGGVGGGMGGGLCAHSCQQLWVMRNQIYKNNGYCFKTSRAIGYFGNAGCYTANPNMSKWERNQVQRIKSCEAAKGC